MTKNNPVMLVVDDDPSFCHLMTRLGERENFKVIAYSSIRNVYRDLEFIDFDVAVIDYDLGPVTGAQFSNYVKRVKKNIPVLLVSSGSMEGAVSESDQVFARESKLSGPYKIFLSAIMAFDKFQTTRT